MLEKLRRKWSFKINGLKQILIKRAEEKDTHVFMKIFLAKLYASQYEDIKIETRYSAEKRYKPDLLATDLRGEALFWGECGEVSVAKIHHLISKYRNTHFCFAKWNIKPLPFERILEKKMNQLKKSRSAPIDFINFSEENKHAIAENGEITIDWEDIYFRQWSVHQA
ncbi:hypothetical protein WJR50_33475 [Catalinimonas sp. 4WD22]|uniref:hypothetical protein n=1 Tax=Catalinimonas locisalis TaxID=3133978 RepID=UPI003100DC22